ncbi:hypothetical protein LJR071_001095 [Pseudomonas sp. LjRoot71]|uniref:hypothetical protein n=1 Tax=Pseudomonas sp. LjRoot71 TaxID=3342336 RepID=UPI003ECE0814
MRTALIVSIIGIAGGSYLLAGVPLTEFQNKYISIFGTLGTITGLVYAIAQIALMRKESEVISETAKETKSQVLLITCIADWARGVKVAQEVQIYCRSGKREIAIPRIQELKQILQDIVNAANSEIKNTHGTNAANQIISLNIIINGFEKDTRAKMSGEEVARVNNTLEATIDLLNEIQSITKNKG